mmetsp:Transcript_78880/g.218210  ORF Transcript_78880/g.218210 Transcript_78880/m.218210 type:complete len:129 (+) Transcript_78880:155-541(+)
MQIGHSHWVVADSAVTKDLQVGQHQLAPLQMKSGNTARGNNLRGVHKRAADARPPFAGALVGSPLFSSSGSAVSTAGLLTSETAMVPSLTEAICGTALTASTVFLASGAELSLDTTPLAATPAGGVTV